MNYISNISKIIITLSKDLIEIKNLNKFNSTSKIINL